MDHARSSPNPPTVKPPSGVPVLIRDFRPADQDQVSSLYREGLLIGHLDPFDQATDLEHIVEIYLVPPRNHFWVAEIDGQVVGTVAIAQDQPEIAHLRRLRVAPNWQSDGRVAGHLLQAAMAHARQQGFLKMILHTPVDDRRAIPLLHRLGLEFARSRDVHGRHVLEFYLNLYSKPTSMDQAALEDWRLV